METPSELAELIDDNRHINVGADWSEYITERTKDRMKAIGFDVDNLSFSGFCSQGDGACFTGSVDNMPLFIRSNMPDFDRDYPMIRKLMDVDGDFGLTVVSHGSRYYHSNSVYAYVNNEEFAYILNTKELIREQVVEVMDKELSVQIGGFEDAAQVILRGFMDSMYKELDTEYEYLTSDDAVQATLNLGDL